MDEKRDDRQGMSNQQTVTVVTVDIDGDKDAMGDREWEAYDEFVSTLRAAGIRVAWYEYDDGTWDKNGKDVSGRGERMTGQHTIEWTSSDQDAAQAQGWRVGSNMHLDESVRVIERLDDPSSIDLPYPEPRFPSDEHAEAYVRGRADMGCELAQRALAWTSHVYRVVGRLDDWSNVGSKG